MIEEEETMERTGSNSLEGRRSRWGRSLGEALDKQLASCAAAASAAGVGSRACVVEGMEAVTRAASAVGAGLLLSAGPASARIVYTPAYTTVSASPSHPFPLDLNHDGITDFNLFSVPGLIGLLLRQVSPAQAGNGILGKTQGALSIYLAPYTCRVASALPAGHRIGPGSKFGAYQTMYFHTFNAPVTGPFFGLTCGYWSKAQGRFLGFEFTAQGQKHYGWARLNIAGGRATLTGYAYETEPNKPIRARDTGPVADAPVPEMHSAPRAIATLRPATLGLLALGSRGLDVWRKEQ